MIFSHLKRLLQKILLNVLNVYIRYFSYFFPPVCRFYPSCSHYAQDAIKAHGVILGLYYSVRRLLRCHPWHKGGYDPIPEKTTRFSTSRCSGHAHTPNLIED